LQRAGHVFITVSVELHELMNLCSTRHSLFWRRYIQPITASTVSMFIGHSCSCEEQHGRQERTELSLRQWWVTHDW